MDLQHVDHACRNTSGKEVAVGRSDIVEKFRDVFKYLNCSLRDPQIKSAVLWSVWSGFVFLDKAVLSIIGMCGRS